MSDDLYETLGISRDAGQDDIKRRYRQLAKELHPDLNPDKPDVAERFSEVTAAYDILSDPEKRGQYDRGEIDAKGHERPQQQFYRDFADTPDGAKYYRQEGFPDDEALHDFFSDLFQGRGDDRRSFRMRARGADVAYNLTIDFLEATKGAKKRVVMADGRNLDLTIPAGARDRQTLRLKGRGQPGFEGGEPGDAFVELHIRPHNIFERKDNDIHMHLPVSPAEAMLGGKVSVPTIEGAVTMTVPKGSNAGSTLRLRGKGIVDQRTGQRGDQYVHLKVVLPKSADPTLEDMLRRWQTDHSYDPRDGWGESG
ncbi:MAG: J domain-containing protein [Alphaproteobacteria bacterium]|nr:J domain-containing protein [Alphaproteobacteria bacterium]